MVALAVQRTSRQAKWTSGVKRAWAQHRLLNVLFYSPLVAPVLLAFSFGRTDGQCGSTSFHINQWLCMLMNPSLTSYISVLHWCKVWRKVFETKILLSVLMLDRCKTWSAAAVRWGLRQSKSWVGLNFSCCRGLLWFLDTGCGKNCLSRNTEGIIENEW